MTDHPYLQLRVKDIRSQNLCGRGGAIFSAIEVDNGGKRLDDTKHYVVKAPYYLLHAAVEPGQLWRVSGPVKPNTITVNGFHLTEDTITAERMELLRPSGEHIIGLLAESQQFAGIGQVKARRLWDRFGSELYRLLDGADAPRLAEVLPLKMAQNLVDAWSRWGDSFMIQWLQSRGIPIHIAKKVRDLHGRDTARLLEEDPYRLIGFAVRWEIVDRLARDTFGIGLDDPRRLAGGAEEALYAAFERGDTCLDLSAFTQRLRRVLGPLGQLAVESAVKLGIAGGSLLIKEGLCYAPGPLLMETAVAHTIASMVHFDNPLLALADLENLITTYESDARLTNNAPAYALNPEQRAALILANASPFAVITGGAGTGKTTVLRALFELFSKSGHEIYAMAISGRAARRITEATGHTATTVAGFISSFRPDASPGRVALVIDEASMVDLPSIYRIIRLIPPHYRLVLVGDPNQLPPVGPGLVLHELCGVHGIPLVELTEVRRHSGALAQAAAQIKNGKWPDLIAAHAAEIAFIPCAASQVNDQVLNAYAQAPDITQILCPTRHAAAGGAAPLNSLCQQRYNHSGDCLTIWNPAYDLMATTKFRVGDPVIWTKNDWDLDIQNGSVGVLVSLDQPSRDENPKRTLGRIRWDDGRVLDFTADFVDRLDLAYAITIHKSQGSAYRRVIVPVMESRLLDRTLLYTAVTRAVNQAILIGDNRAAQSSVIGPPQSNKRSVGLRFLVQEQMKLLSTPQGSGIPINPLKYKEKPP